MIKRQEASIYSAFPGLFQDSKQVIGEILLFKWRENFRRRVCHSSSTSNEMTDLGCGHRWLLQLRGVNEALYNEGSGCCLVINN